MGYGYTSSYSGLSAKRYLSSNTTLIGGGYKRQRMAAGRTTATKTLTVAKTTNKPNARSLKTKIMNLKPAKHFTSEAGVSMLHQTLYSMFPTAGVVQGTGDDERIGDHIFLAAIKMKGMFSTDPDAGAYSYRILVGYTGEEYLSPVLSSVGLSAGEVFLPNTFTTWRVGGLVNPKAFTCLYDETFDVNSQIDGFRDLTSFSFSVPLNKSFPYQASSSPLGKFKNLAVVVVGGIAGGAQGVNDLGGISYAYDLIFKD